MQTYLRPGLTTHLNAWSLNRQKGASLIAQSSVLSARATSTRVLGETPRQYVVISTQY